MSLKYLSIISISVLCFISCSSNKQSIMWVSGLQTECQSKNLNDKCLEVFEGENLDNVVWQPLYSNIDGFNFEHGVLQKIEVKEVTLDNTTSVPGDQKNYRLVKVIESQPDSRIALNGKWMLSTLDGDNIDRSLVLPVLNFSTDKMRVSGTGGCNNYSGNIDIFKMSEISFSQVVSTKKACLTKNIEKQFLENLRDVKAYKMENENLIFYNSLEENTLTFTKQKRMSDKDRLHDIWIAVRIDGTPLNKNQNKPQLEINIKKKRVFGNDGCNEYSGDLIEVTNDKITFGPLPATKKMCQQLDVSNAYYKALSLTENFKLDGLNLSLLDINGKELLYFIKGD